MMKSILTILLASFSTAALSADREAVIALGQQKYAVCAACHGMTGNGQPVPGMNMAPSFMESKLVTAPPEISALILFKGIKKEDMTAYMGQMMMPLGAAMPDEDVAALITYVRSKYGEIEDEVVTAEQVGEWRKKYAETAQPTRKELEAMMEKMKD